MPKKTKTKTVARIAPEATRQIGSRDALLRMNMLYQLQELQANNNGLLNLNHYFGSQLMLIKEKNQVKLTPQIRRTLCGSCKSLLVPGENATVVWKKTKRRPRFQKITCKVCQNTKALPWNKGKKLALENLKQPSNCY